MRVMGSMTGGDPGDPTMFLLLRVAWLLEPSVGLREDACSKASSKQQTRVSVLRPRKPTPLGACAANADYGPWSPAWAFVKMPAAKAVLTSMQHSHMVSLVPPITTKLCQMVILAAPTPMQLGHVVSLVPPITTKLCQMVNLVPPITTKLYQMVILAAPTPMQLGHMVY